MKRTILFIAVAIVALTSALPSAAQVRFGVKAGICLNEMHFSKDDLTNSDNRSGFAGGIMLDGRIPLPLIGFAFDASAMYVRRSVNKDCHDDFISIPVNLKYRFGLPVISEFLVPFLTTGPEWSYMIDHSKNIGFDTNKSNFSWNFGLGLEVLSHVQLAASYGIGLSKTYESDHNDGKNRYWTVTAAYLF